MVTPEVTPPGITRLLYNRTDSIQQDRPKTQKKKRLTQNKKTDSKQNNKTDPIPKSESTKASIGKCSKQCMPYTISEIN